MIETPGLINGGKRLAASEGQRQNFRQPDSGKQGTAQTLR